MNLDAVLSAAILSFDQMSSLTLTNQIETTLTLSNLSGTRAILCRMSLLGGSMCGLRLAAWWTPCTLVLAEMNI
jgi:hypothetical protein